MKIILKGFKTTSNARLVVITRVLDKVLKSLLCCKTTRKSEHKSIEEIKRGGGLQLSHFPCRKFENKKLVERE